MTEITTGQEDGADKTEPQKKVAEKDARRKKATPTLSGKPSPDTPAQDKATSPKKTGRRLWRWLLILTVILLLVAGGLLGWQWYQSRQFTPAEEASAVTASPLPGVPAEYSLANLEQALAEERQAREELQQSLQQALAGLSLDINSNAERLRQLSTTTREDWLLAEAEYLLRLANQRLLTERQGKNALALMESADGILRDINDTALFPVRKALARDITNLRLAGAVDREGIYLQLNALSDAVIQLPLLAGFEGDEGELQEAGRETLTDKTLPSEEAPWYQKLQQNALAALKPLSGLITVRRLRDPMEPLLLPVEEMQLRQELRLAFQQAQLALLREEQVVYEVSLTRAEEWLQDYFEHNIQTQQVLEQINSLRSQQIVQPLPSAAVSLKALQDYISLWHNRSQSSPGSDSGAESHP